MKPPEFTFPSLAIDLYELTMAQVYFNCKKDTRASFEVFIRSSKRPFYVICGIDEVVEFIKNFKFQPEDISYLRKTKLFSRQFLGYLKNFKFTGEVWGVEEPEIIFPNEPILRISAPLIEAQILESGVLNIINLATTLATKSARVVLSAGGRGVYDFSLRRTQGLYASLAAAKYSYIAGARGTSNVLAGKLYNIPVVGTMAHSFVMSFPSEKISFSAFAENYPENSIFLIDTYNVKKGLKNALEVGKVLKEKGITFKGIRLDSGNLKKDAKYAREVMDREGFKKSLILASGNLDEYKIAYLLKDNSCFDAFGVGTKMGTSSDLPFTDVIYKLVEIKEKGSKNIPVMKLSKDKLTLPFKKNVFRRYRSGLMSKDYLGIFDENLAGKKLIRPLLLQGRKLYAERTIEDMRKLFSRKIKTLPPYLRYLYPQKKYPVHISKKLLSLTTNLEKHLQGKYD